MTQTEVFKYYDENCESYREFMNRLTGKIKDELITENINGAIITSRIKDRNHFAKKVERKGYEDLENEFTDFCGIRIIVKDLIGVEAVADYIVKNYKIDWKNSEDKKKLLSTDKVGYLSIHYIISFSDSDAQTTRYKDYAKLKAEVQVRTILQHAWSEMTHDTIYHTKGNIGADKRRTVNLIAGLLELADINIKELNLSISNEILAVNNKLEIELTDTLLLNHMQNTFYDSYMIDIEQCLHTLKLCSINTLQDLKNLCDKSVVQFINENDSSFQTYDEILKELLIVKDAKTYIEKVGCSTFSTFELNLYKNFKISIEKYFN